jgi:small subunit ribosomal protein S3
MKNAGDSLKLVKVGSTQAYLKAGVIGVTVKLVLPDTKFPDQLNVLKPDQVIPAPEEEKPKKKRARKKKAPEAAPQEAVAQEAAAAPVTDEAKPADAPVEAKAEETAK